jgi:hypothetical protein
MIKGNAPRLGFAPESFGHRQYRSAGLTETLEAGMGLGG